MTLSPEFCFVVDEEEGLCGYALAGLDAVELQAKSDVSWIPAMRHKYPKPVKDDMSPADVSHYLPGFDVAIVTFLLYTGSGT